MFEKLVIKICIVCVVVVLLLIIYDILSFSFMFEKSCEDLRSLVCNFNS